MFDHGPGDELVVAEQQSLGLAEQGHGFVLGADCAEDAALDALRLAFEQAGDASAAAVVANVVGHDPVPGVGGVLGRCGVVAAHRG